MAKNQDIRKRNKNWNLKNCPTLLQPKLTKCCQDGPKMNLLKHGVRWERRPNILLPPSLKTLNEKKLEVPVKKILSGTPVEKAVNIDSMSNPHAIVFFVKLAGEIT